MCIHSAPPLIQAKKKAQIIAPPSKGETITWALSHCILGSVKLWFGPASTGSSAYRGQRLPVTVTRSPRLPFKPVSPSIPYQWRYVKPDGPLSLPPHFWQDFFPGKHVDHPDRMAAGLSEQDEGAATTVRQVIVS